uniref:Synaptobrevin n=1 Tax=Lygus hesperus TaxID=30085 RepID=A0A146M880_LYGHE
MNPNISCVSSVKKTASNNKEMDGDQNPKDSPVYFEKIGLAQERVDEVVVIMGKNIEQVAVRGGKLNELDERADRLNQTANQFKGSAIKLRKKMWWRKKRNIAILGGVGGLLPLIVIICIAV